MSDSIKDKITADLQKAKSEGQLRSERIREIVQSAVSQARAEIKEGSVEIRSLVREAVSTVIENLKDRGGEIKEDVAASIEGAIEGVSSARRDAIAKTKEEVKQLQSQIDREETQLQEEIDGALVEIEKKESDRPSNIKAAIASAIDTIKNSEEVALMQKRYAQLQAQLAVLRANLAARYGEQEGEIQQHLDEAKSWYDRTQVQAEATAETVKQKRAKFEAQLGEAGTAAAKKERQLKQRLRELWQSATELFQDKQPPRQ
jgi:hypothetical protein